MVNPIITIVWTILSFLETKSRKEGILSVVFTEHFEYRFGSPDKMKLSKL